MKEQFEQAKELMVMFNDSKMTSLKLKIGDFSIKLSKEGLGAFDTAALNEGVKKAGSKPAADKKLILPDTIAEPMTIIPEETDELKPGEIVRSPIVGTYYESSAPGKPPFVKVGDKISDGQVLCIIEAMKVMNEITAKLSGEVAEVYAANEQVVEFGQPLFRIV